MTCSLLKGQKTAAPGKRWPRKSYVQAQVTLKRRLLRFTNRPGVNGVDLALPAAAATIAKRLHDMLLSTLYSARRNCTLPGCGRAAFVGLCLRETRFPRTYWRWF